MGGCAPTTASQRTPEPVAITATKPPELFAPKRGSLWQTTDRNTMFLDNKARNVGDIITVLVSESSSAAKNASTDLSRDSSDEMDFGDFFGLSKALGGKDFVVDTSAEITGKHEYSGAGTTSRDGVFTATISCQVTEVLSNGNLRIEGRRDITVNNENQYIILSGIIRTEDITSNNNVNSAQIADARIEYSGEGDLDDQQNPNWVNKIMSKFNIM